MAKSTGDRVLVDDLLRNCPPAAIRLLCLNRAWAAGWSYSIDDLEAAAAPLQDLYAAAAKPGQAGVVRFRALLDDLDMPTALSIALEDGDQAARTLIELLALRWTVTAARRRRSQPLAMMGGRPETTARHTVLAGYGVGSGYPPP